MRDGLNVVVTGETLHEPVPDTLADDSQMDAWLSSKQQSEDHEYCKTSWHACPTVHMASMLYCIFILTASWVQVTCARCLYACSICEAATGARAGDKPSPSCTRVSTPCTHTHSHTAIYVLPTGRKGAQQRADGGSRLVMGTAMRGWFVVSSPRGGARDADLTSSLQTLPKVLASVVRGHDLDATSALVESSVAGARESASSARFGGEVTARDVGTPTPLRITFTLLVGCASDGAEVTQEELLLCRA